MKTLKRKAEDQVGPPAKRMAGGEGTGGNSNRSNRRGELESRKGKGNGKGKNKGGRGKGGAAGKSASGCAKETPDGRQICFKYNNPSEGCKTKGCRFAHCCGKCFKEGCPMFSCDHKRSS